MKYKHPLLLFLLIILGVVTNPVFAVDYPLEDDIVLPSASTSALGGPHTASTQDINVLFTNPAAYQIVDPQWSYSELTLSLNGPVFDIASLVLNVMDSTNSGESETAFLAEMVQFFSDFSYAGLGLSGPIYFGYVGDGFGIGLYNVTDVSFQKLDQTTLGLGLGESVILTGGYTFRIPLPSESHFLDVGLSVKGLIRAELAINLSLFELFSYFSNFDVNSVLSEPFDFLFGFGFDIGLLYTYDDWVKVALVGQDVFTPTFRSEYDNMQAFSDGEDSLSTDNGYVPVKLNAGIEFTPPLGVVERYISDLRILLDYEDIFDFLMYPETANHPLLHIGAGIEIELLEILDIRVGLYQGLFAAGLGIDLDFFQIQASMYGTELGSQPGMNSVYNIDIGFEFRD